MKRFLKAVSIVMCLSVLCSCGDGSTEQSQTEARLESSDVQGSEKSTESSSEESTSSLTETGMETSLAEETQEENEVESCILSFVTELANLMIEDNEDFGKRSTFDSVDGYIVTEYFRMCREKFEIKDEELSSVSINEFDIVNIEEDGDIINVELYVQYGFTCKDPDKTCGISDTRGERYYVKLKKTDNRLEVCDIFSTSEEFRLAKDDVAAKLGNLETADFDEQCDMVDEFYDQLIKNIKERME